MKIGVKITLLVVIAVVGAVVISIVSIINLSKLNDASTYIYLKPVKNSQYVNRVLDHVNNLTRQTAMMCIDQNPAESKRRIDGIANSRTILWSNLDSLEKNVSAPEVKKLVADLRPALEAIREQVNAFLAEFEAKNLENMIRIRTGVFQARITECQSVTQIVLEAVDNQVEQSAMIDTEAVYETSFTTLIIVSIIVAILLIVIAVVIITGITKPLKKAVEAAEKIASGNLNVDLETKSKDETGMLIKSMEDMVNSINGMGDDVEKLINEALAGNLKYRADANKHQGTYKEIIKGTNELIEAFVEPINTTAKFLEDAAYGSDKLAGITKEYKGDFNAIKNNINSLHKTLFLILGEMDTVGKASKVGDLSKRADTSKVQGAWITIMTGLNDVVEASDAIINDAGKVLGIMATGDLTPRVTKPYPGKFGEMKDNINNLGDSLTDLISQLQQAIHTTASASAQISSTADTLAAATQEQSSQTDEVASAMEEMSRTVTDNAHSATKTADVARQSGEVASSGGRVVEQTVDKMKEIASVVKMSADNIAKLGESSKKIGEIIGVIDDIADQTNLLSLNAAIEAARAGEQGRGFAVVADSVGKLAVSTASATKEIADMIKGIQADTDAAVKAMEKGTSEVQSGIELADNAGHSIQDILTGINELLDMVNQIAAASEEQSATSEQISKNVSSISKVTADSARNVEDVAATANELARMTETLTSLVSQFKIGVGTSNNHSLNGNDARLLN